MRTFGVLLLGLFLAGCASTPPTIKYADNFLEVGTVYPKFKGNTFYMAIGQGDLYRYGFWGNLEKTGKKIDLAVVIQADPDSGMVQRIATLQPRDVYAAGEGPYSVGDLRGGFLLTDFQPYPHWLDAVTEMETAAAKLNPTTPDYASVSQPNGTVVFVTSPPLFGWGGGYGHPYFHRRRF